MEVHTINGDGEKPGTIMIMDETTNEILGEWDAVARDGSGATDVFWDVFPDIDIMSGHTYRIYDSSPDTWSCNKKSNYQGFVEFRGTYG